MTEANATQDLTATSLQYELFTLYKGLMNGNADPKVVRAANDIASTIIRSAVAQEKMYARMEDTETVVGFLRETP